VSRPSGEDEAFDELCADLFGPGAEAEGDAQQLQLQIARLEDSQREGMCAIRHALRALREAIGIAGEELSDTEKLTAIVNEIGVAIAALDPDGDGVDDCSMSDSHE
jgi:hypothetical protein